MANVESLHICIFSFLLSLVTLLGFSNTLYVGSHCIVKYDQIID